MIENFFFNSCVRFFDRNLRGGEGTPCTRYHIIIVKYGGTDRSYPAGDKRYHTRYWYTILIDKDEVLTSSSSSIASQTSLAGLTDELKKKYY